MARSSSSRAAVVVAAAIVAFCAALSSATVTVNEPIVNGLSWSFYDASCPSVEGIVRWHVADALRRDIGLAAGLIRIFFHDCFPQGCDASILLSGSGSEQNEIPNETLRKEALKLIDDIRAAVHAACAGPKVSCADIITLATRDAVVASGGPFFEVPLGRRDGLTPASQNQVFTLPRPDSDVPTLLGAFKNRSLDAVDLVALSGAHTIGRGHCSSFNDRLPPNADDGTMDPAFRRTLADKCANNDKAEQVLDVRTPNAFDNKYYFDLIAKQGLFKSDQALMVDRSTNRTATRYALNQAAFFDQFARSMVKMSQMDVLTGNAGEVRFNCAVRNPRLDDTAAGDEGLAADA